jgi:starch synthase
MPEKVRQSVGGSCPTLFRQHAFAATNPCHVWDLARGLYGLGLLGVFHSGYPRWRLNPPLGFPLRTHSGRTLLTYGLQRLPQWVRPPDERVFRWQDVGFDREAAEHLECGEIFHGIPGQCLECFRVARRLGMVTVLNHASGPLEVQSELVRPEYERAGIPFVPEQAAPAWLLERLMAERELADVHCVASRIVRDQLIQTGIPGDRVSVIPYGVDPFIFNKREQVPSGPFRVCFAGRHSLRKAIRVLLGALELAGSVGWEAHFVGTPLRESEPAFRKYRGRVKLFRHGPLSQTDLARMFSGMDVLVLPSVEEAFGLVVAQALNCGVPCVVSDRVGAADLIKDGENGTIVPFGDVPALLAALTDWSSRRVIVPDGYGWPRAAAELARTSLRWRARAR